MPELSLLVPLEDVRGDALDHLRTWTHEQSLPRERYQVVVASSGEDPEAEERVRKLLAGHDAFECVPGANLLGLYNAAAARADSDWLVLTEGHVEADAACLAAAARSLQNGHGHEVLTFRIGRITSSAYSELNSRWVDKIVDGWDQPGQWQRLSPAGFAIRREIYQQAGGFDPRYGLFAIPLLSARVDQRGTRVGQEPEAVVLHVQPETVEESHGHTADYARGECEARTREDRVFCERYFGTAPIWTNRRRYQPGLAGRASAVIAASAARAVLGRRAELPWLLRALRDWLPPAAAGTRLHMASANLLLRTCELVTKAGFVPPELRWRASLRGQDLAVERTQVEWVRDEAVPPAPPPAWSGRRGIEEFSPDELVGVHGLEPHGEQWFRWTEPVVVLRLPAARAARRLQIDTGGLRGSPLDGLRSAYVDGRRVPPAGLVSEGSAVTVPLPRGRESGGGITTVTLLSRPLEQRPSAPRDPRRLGLPIVSIDL